MTVYHFLTIISLSLPFLTLYFSGVQCGKYFVEFGRSAHYAAERSVLPAGTRQGHIGQSENTGEFQAFLRISSGFKWIHAFAFYPTFHLTSCCMLA